MKRERLFCIAAGWLLACCVSVTAQELGFWRAASKTAQSITGDVGLSDAYITIYFYNFAIVRARDLEPAEVSSVFDADSNSGKKGRLYGVSIPAAKRFMHKNTLCGGDDVRWMATYVDGNTLQLAFFSGAKPPVFTADAIPNSTDLCGTYSYTR
ncbi:MAG TPA: hypothetical protein VHT28_05500 [Silvibacterium sp.]|jgi:hypothetical protein|nr:hypothetical protein [Silvibacterium sp.]